LADAESGLLQMSQVSQALGKFVWVTISTKMLTQKQMIDFFTVFPEWLRGFKSPNWVTIEMSAFGLRDGFIET
jgi:hypothetical protein